MPGLQNPMNTLLSVLLATIAFIVAAWLVRRRKGGTTTIEGTTRQAGDSNPMAVEPTESPEGMPVVPPIASTPAETLPGTPVPTAIETTPDEVAATIPDAEKLSPPDTSQRVISSIEGVDEPSGNALCELLTAEPQTPAPLSELRARVVEPAVESNLATESTNPGGPPVTVPLSTDTAKSLTPPIVDLEVPSLKPSPVEPEPMPKPPIYHPPAPPPTKQRTSDKRTQTPRSAQESDTELQLRVQLVFGRGGTLKTLALVPDRREGMPSDIRVTGALDDLQLAEWSADCYEPVPIVDAANLLLQGMEWRGHGDLRRWRWALSGRELYVLVPGDEFGLHGFVSRRKDQRLWLRTRHMVLAKASLRDQVLAALTAAGCTNPEMNDDPATGIPPGWILFRDVMPTRAVPMRGSNDILNILCPASEVEPHFVGGIRLERNTWLVGFSPRIRFSGEPEEDFQVLIDGDPASIATDGAFEAPGWDREGEHRLWFADQVATYTLVTMDENWERWNAHDFGPGIGVCGPSIRRSGGTPWHQVRVPVANSLLVGARPGEIFRCQMRRDVCSETLSVLVPFLPVWALPLDPLHADKRSAHLVLLNAIVPSPAVRPRSRRRDTDRALREWSAAINDAGRKHLAPAGASENVLALWRLYRAEAKRLRKWMR